MSLLLFKVSRVSSVSTSTPDSGMVIAVTRHVPVDESLKSCAGVKWDRHA